MTEGGKGEMTNEKEMEGRKGGREGGREGGIWKSFLLDGVS